MSKFGSILIGRIWKFGDNISTDLMMPGFAPRPKSLNDKDAMKCAKFCMHSNRKGWSELVKDGDIIVGGMNFGCGSSRPAALNLIILGVTCVIADSMSRLFFRNSIALGLPVIIAPGISDFCEEGDNLKIKFDKGIITNINTSEELKFSQLNKNSPPYVILKAGGILNFLKKRN
jgi:3-isopropylmalate/(R)-2-methylmalate dehydratase small subunit